MEDGIVRAKPCSYLHSLSCPQEILLVNKHYQQKHNFATSTAALTALSSDTAHVILQAAEKVRGHLFCGFHAGLFINQQTSGPACRHPVQKGPREASSFAWCSFFSGPTFLKWKQWKLLQERPHGYGHPSSLILSLQMDLEQFLLCNQNIIPIQSAAALWQ